MTDQGRAERPSPFFAMPATLTAPCKINLCLAITGRRADGYHELDTWFYPLPAPCDTLELAEAAPGSGLILDCSAPGIDARDNLVFKAWDRFGHATGFRPDLRVGLTKRIPSGAGLGGGSSDCAAMLLWLNQNAGRAALDADALNSLAAGLGADVPFFLLGRPARATGIGELLAPVSPDLSGLHLVLVCPDIHVPTPWAFAQWDAANPGPAPARAGSGLTTQGPESMKHGPRRLPALVNDFEPVVFARHPELSRIKQTLLAAGAAASLMSGSGASVYGLFRRERQAAEAAERIARTGATTHLLAL